MVNCDATVQGTNTTLSFVVRDEIGLLVVAIMKLTQVFSAYEAKTKAIEWAACYADGKP